MLPDPDGVDLAPLVIAVTGHRNLVEDEVPRIVDAIRQVFEELLTKFPQTPVVLLSPLAEGGGRLAAKVAIELNIELFIPLPFQAELYKADFESAASLEEFEWLCQHGTVIELPLRDGNTIESVAVDGPQRNSQYMQSGVFLSSHSQILLAIWDGKPSDAFGGTAQVVGYHLTDIVPGMTDVEATAQQLLGRDENDLVYHIVCSRDQPNGSTAEHLQPLQTYWITSDEKTPTTTLLTDSNERVFLRMNEFNADAKRHWRDISKHACGLIGSGVAVRDNDKKTNSLFKTADWLANHYQQRVRAMFQLSYALAVGMGLAFIAYADLPFTNLPSQNYMIYVFLMLFGIGLVLYRIAERRQWHRKYVDYRALAEGLRVQFYWQLAGVSTGTETHFAHDNFLQKQDIELGWIRNVMRAGCIPSNSAPPPSGGLDDAIGHWIGDRPTSQLNYYRHKAVECERLDLITRGIAMACLWAGIAVAIILAIFHNELSNETRDPLVLLMGVLPLIAAVRSAYAHKKADKELIKQYRFMGRIFSSAKRQLDNAKSDREKRAILKALGDAALDEHAEWIMMHRERPLEHGVL